MKNTILTFVIFFLFGFMYSFAADVEENTIPEENTVTVQDPQVMPENTVSESVKEGFIKKAVKRKTIKRLMKKTNKIMQDDETLQPQRVNALMVVGFLLLIPGMVLSMLGVALIPAIVLALVGGTLFIIGVLKMKNSM